MHVFQNLILGASLLFGGTFANAAAAPTDAAATKAVEDTLNQFHHAAATADGKTYFNLFAPEGVFLGTDASERWTVDEFKAYAQPYFAKGKGWTYTPRQRHVQVVPGGEIAWFDEILDNAAFGTCRGSGVLRKINNSWYISQYHLTIPVPNALAGKLAEMIRDQKTAAKVQ